MSGGAWRCLLLRATGHGRVAVRRRVATQVVGVGSLLRDARFLRLLERVDACLGPDLDPRGPSNIVWRLGTPRASHALMWDASRADASTRMAESNAV
eukprot:s843_g10.t1